MPDLSAQSRMLVSWWPIPPCENSNWTGLPNMLYVDLPPLIIDNYSNIIYMNITVCTYLQLRFSCVTRLSCISFEVGCVHWWRFTGWSKMHPPKLQNTTRRIASAIRLDPHGATRKGGRCTIAGLGRHDAESLKYIEKRCHARYLKSEPD